VPFTFAIILLVIVGTPFMLLGSILTLMVIYRREIRGFAVRVFGGK
jgi:hypothetical protein